MNARSRLLVSLAVAGLLFGACGDDDDDVLDRDTTVTTEDETTTSGAETTTGEQAAPQLEGPVNDRGTATITGPSVAVGVVDFAFEPTFLADGTESVTVQLENTGAVAHTFTIESQGIDEVLEPGRRAEVRVEVPSGQDPTVFICRFHVAQGMRGALLSS